MCEISRRIERVASSRPDATALRKGEARLSYAVLDRAANRMAGHLASLGVTDGATVAICLERGFDQITAALAAMRAGSAYVPLDPAWPTERMRTILADAGATVLVAPRELTAAVGGGVIGLCPAADADALAMASPEPVHVVDRAETLAYVIYTSGSTGKPKGVEITHENLSHLITWHTQAFRVTEEDHASHLAGLGFDASVWEVWPYLAVGACVSLVDDTERTSPGLLLDWLVAQRITMAFVPTPLAEPMMGMDWPAETALRYLLTGGDTLHAAPKAGLPFEVVNNYGPTECTVVATSGIVHPEVEGLPSIGLPITGTRIYVLDESGDLAGVSETGELYIAGAGVGRGYRNLPEQTTQSFVPDRLSGVPGGRMYRTGDRAAIRSDGQIEFRGRIDGQEKVRGQRLELNEIVCVLNRHPEVAFNVVLARGEGMEKQLVAYVLPVEEAAPTGRELQAFLAELLPSVMVPTVFVSLDRLPLNANGKVDNALLPEPSEDNTLAEDARRGPANLVEQSVLDIVQRLLKTNDVGVEDDFFLVGGHSLLGTQLVMRLRESFGVQLTLRDLFDSCTVELLAARIEEMLMAELDAMTDEEAAMQITGDAAAIEEGHQ